MGEEILINFTPMETRVAIIENGMPWELYVERTDHRGIVGNIYQGKVVRVLPGMQAAFVDIGLEKAAFIHVEDLLSAKISHEEKVNTPIAQVLREGQALMVQVTRDPISTKGARLTTFITLPSRYLVAMLTSDHIGISQRIEDTEERDRLYQIVQSIIEEQDLNMGFILRTATEGIEPKALEEDIKFLCRLWDAVKAKTKEVTAPGIIYEDLPLDLRVLRDMAHSGLERIRIDSKEIFAKAKNFAQLLVPEVESVLEHYSGDRPIFDLFSVEEELKKSLMPNVELKSGGYLIIEQTEAMATIDVNTGGFVGKHNLAETIFKTNLEAATAIGRQLRLRNLGGIIIIDFIDMEDQDHQRQVLRTLERALENDYARCMISGVSDLGLVEVTRKRIRESLEHTLCDSCPECKGRGFIKTAETICCEIFREIMRQHHAYEATSYLVLAAPTVVNYMLEDASNYMADLEIFIGKIVRLQAEPYYNMEHFDVVLR